MKAIKIYVDKSEVLRQVALTTGYTGAKAAGDDASKAEAYERIGTVEDDGEALERFWRQATADVLQRLRGLVTGSGYAGDVFEVRLELPDSWDADALWEAMQDNLLSYMVTSVTAGWYVYCNKTEAGEYASRGRQLLEDLHRKALYRGRPKRPTY